MFRFILVIALIGSLEEIFSDENSHIKATQRVNEDVYKKRTGSISEVLGNGRFIQLEDNSLWIVDIQDRIFVAGWLGSSYVTIKYSKTPSNKFSYIITNKDTNKSVRVELKKIN